MAEQEERLTKLFLDFLGAQDDGYQGSFEEYHWDRFGEESPTVPVRRALQASDEDARVSNLMLLTPAGRVPTDLFFFGPATVLPLFEGLGRCVSKSIPMARLPSELTLCAGNACLYIM